MTVIRGLAEAGERATTLPMAEGVRSIQYALGALLSAAPSFAGDETLLSLVVRLTLAPRTMRAHALHPLREAGYSDREIHDVVHVVCCFSYMNRLADGLGVTNDPVLGAGGWAERLMGAERVRQHVIWAAER